MNQIVIDIAKTSQ